MPPREGDTAPDFEGLYCDGQTFRPRTLTDSLGDRGAVLVFGGFVGSAIATNWWRLYELAGWDEFDGVPVHGVHRDGPYAVNAFIREREIPFGLFADVDGEIADAYDLLVERDGMAGEHTSKRAIFVLDDEGVVTYAWETDDWISPVSRSDVAAAVEEL